MHALFGTHKEAALPFFEQLLPDFHSLILVSQMLSPYHLSSNFTPSRLNSRVFSRGFLSSAVSSQTHCAWAALTVVFALTQLPLERKLELALKFCVLH